jgi:hypothetical protein
MGKRVREGRMRQEDYVGVREKDVDRVVRVEVPKSVCQMNVTRQQGRNI